VPKELNMKIITNAIPLLACIGLISVAGAAKVKRVKAGMKYKENDPVHVVVNKVG
jgi:hypothetical protein